jgi:hypothetical protein
MRAGVRRVQVPLDSPVELTEAIRAAGLHVTARLPVLRTEQARTPAIMCALDEIDTCWLYPSEDAIELPPRGRFDGIELSALRFGSQLEEQLGSRLGEAVVCELDAWAASVDVGERGRAAIESAGADPDRAALSLRRYLSGRIDGSVPAELPASTAAVELLLGEDAAPVLKARLDVVATAGAGIAGALRLIDPGLGVSVELDGPQLERGSIALALRDTVDSVAIEGDGSLLSVRRQLVAHRDLAGPSAACVLPVPSSAIPDSERLADALDIVEGLGVDRVVLATNEAWVPIGIDAVARAASRLHGRPVEPAGQARRRELEVG